MSTGPAQFAFGSLSLFMIPLAAEFSWDRTQISLASTFFTATLLFALPIAGRLVDTHGSKRVLVPSMLAVALLLAAIPLTLSEPWHLWLIFALIGSLGAGANALPYMRTVSACFDRHRGLAIGITLAGAGLGYSYVPPLLHYTIESHGWRSAYLLLGGIIIFIALPLVMWLFQEPRGESAPDTAPSRHLRGVSRSTALRGRTFWILFVVFSLLSFSLYGLMVHSVPMLAEFSRHVLEVLREPMETGCITISRAGRQADFPARFQLVAAMNPCPCGYLGDPDANCRCSAERVSTYRGKLSGPLLDRIDIQVSVQRPPKHLLRPDAPSAETSADVLQRVLAARAVQQLRNQCCNALLEGKRLQQACIATEDSWELLEKAMDTFAMSARAHQRIWRVSRTIADLAGVHMIEAEHVGEALSLRYLEIGR